MWFHRETVLPAWGVIPTSQVTKRYSVYLKIKNCSNTAWNFMILDLTCKGSGLIAPSLTVRHSRVGCGREKGSEARAAGPDSSALSHHCERTRPVIKSRAWSIKWPSLSWYTDKKWRSHFPPLSSPIKKARWISHAAWDHSENLAPGITGITIQGNFLTFYSIFFKLNFSKI